MTSVYTDDQRAFLLAHRLVVVGAQRAGAPHLTPVYYVMDGDDLLISTTRSRLKTELIRRNPDVSLCVLAEEFPFLYVLVYGAASIEDAGAADLMMRIGERMTGAPVPEAARPTVEERARTEGRIVLRVRPHRAVATMPLAPKRA